jgi:hypothetical protein
MKSKSFVRLQRFWALWKIKNQAIPQVPLEGQAGKWKAFKPRVKAANGPELAQRSQESILESGGEVGDEAGERWMECEMCAENDKVYEGRGWERHAQWQ